MRSQEPLRDHPRGLPGGKKPRRTAPGCPTRTSACVYPRFLIPPPNWPRPGKKMPGWARHDAALAHPGAGGAAAPWGHPLAPNWGQQHPSTSPHLHPSLWDLWLHFGLICLILRAPIPHGARAYRSAGGRRDPFSFPSQRGTWLLFFFNLPLVLQGRDHHGFLHPSRADFTIP